MTSARRRIQLLLNISAITLIYVNSLALPSKAEAAVYKCIDANDNVSYSQIPCANEETAQTVLSSKSIKKAGMDCRIANNFARQITVRMRQGQSSGEIFDSYGGIDALPRTSVGIISYVYSHKGNIDAVPQRITALSAARCSAGSYGPVNCDDFPYDFIADFGGCERAAMNTAAGLPTTTSDNQTKAPAQEGATQALGASTAGTQKPRAIDCQQDVQAQLSELFDQMHSEQPTNIQVQLESRKKELREQLTNC